jgi:hypothetical protein
MIRSPLFALTVTDCGVVEVLCADAVALTRVGAGIR